MAWINLALALVLISALIVALVTGCAWLDERAARRADAAAVTTHVEAVTSAYAQARAAAAARYDCAPDGVAISSLDRIRLAAIMYDHLLTRGDLHGRPVPEQYVREAARAFAQDLGDPERGAFLLEQCLGRVALDYARGYNLLHTVFSEQARHGA